MKYIKRRIRLANKEYYSLLPTANSKEAEEQTKIRLYKMLTRSILCQEC
jgi:hypothetical protein